MSVTDRKKVIAKSFMSEVTMLNTLKYCLLFLMSSIVNFCGITMCAACVVVLAQLVISVLVNTSWSERCLLIGITFLVALSAVCAICSDLENVAGYGGYIISVGFVLVVQVAV